MKTAAIIAEFNPFHNGHKYLIEKARQVTGADRIIILMSGDFVQRGLPAMTDKRTRAKMALLAGADLVLLYPVRFATSSAEGFAYNAVRILEGLRCVDYLVFGSENGDIKLLEETADFFFEENDDYKIKLKKYLAEGKSFPSARALACEEYSDIIRLPNNILAVEYLKALKKLGSDIKPVTVKRNTEKGIIDQANISKYSGGYEIRRALLEQADMKEVLASEVPEESLSVLLDSLNEAGLVDIDDFSLILKYSLMQTDRPENLSEYADVSIDISNSIFKNRFEFDKISELAEKIVSKNYTRTRIDRSLLHVLLGIKKNSMEAMPFAWMLGLNRGSSDLMRMIKEKSLIPILSKAADAGKILDEKQMRIFDEEILASNVYESVKADKYNNKSRQELTKEIILI